MPAGFPAPRSVTISDYTTTELAELRSKLDALLVQYVEDKRAFDFVTERTETKTETVGAFGDDGYMNVFTERTFRQYRKIAQPAVAIREELIFEKRRTSGNAGGLGETRETYDYDTLGRFTGRTKVVYARVPDLITYVPFTQLVSQEIETVTYSAHPFQPRAQYMSRRDLVRSALIAVDDENQQLGRPFEREYTQSYRSGNLVQSMSTRFGPVRTLTETFEPHRDGQVTIKTTETDHLAGIVTSDTKEDRAGDIALSATSATPGEILVFDADNADRTTDRVDTLSVGELPLLYAVPLARRILKNRKTKGRTARVDVIGYSPALRKGLPVRLTGRNGDQYADHLIIGRTITASSRGAAMQLEVREI